MEGRHGKDLQEVIIATPNVAVLQASPIFVGARIKMTLLGATRNPYFAEKEGTVVGRSRTNGSFRVLFDGRKTPVSLHRDYLEASAFERG